MYSRGRKTKFILLRIGSSALKRKSISINAMLIDRQTISLSKAGMPCLKSGGAVCCNALIDVYVAYSCENTPPNLSMRSSAMPQPRATQVNGSSGT